MYQGGSNSSSAAETPIMSPVETTGDAQHYELDDPRLTGADGEIFAAKMHLTNGAFHRLSVNGGPERDIIPVTAGVLLAERAYLFTYDASQGYYFVISKLALTPDDMPELGSTRCSRNTDQTGISGDGTFHTITFNSVDFNTGSNFSWSGGVATCLVAGRYAAASQLFLSTGGYHAIRHNSAQKAAIFSAEVWTQCFLPPVDLQVGDTIDCRVRTASTATAYYTDVGAVGSLASWLAIWRVK